MGVNCTLAKIYTTQHIPGSDKCENESHSQRQQAFYHEKTRNICVLEPRERKSRGKREMGEKDERGKILSGRITLMMGMET
jgi:hypothetical protein